jgi:hypothetical protein
LETCIGEIQKRQKAAKYPMAYWHTAYDQLWGSGGRISGFLWCFNTTLSPLLHPQALLLRTMEEAGEFPISSSLGWEITLSLVKFLQILLGSGHEVFWGVGCGWGWGLVFGGKICKQLQITLQCNFKPNVSNFLHDC